MVNLKKGTWIPLSHRIMEIRDICIMEIYDISMLLTHTTNYSLNTMTFKKKWVSTMRYIYKGNIYYMTHNQYYMKSEKRTLIYNI